MHRSNRCCCTNSGSEGGNATTAAVQVAESNSSNAGIGAAKGGDVISSSAIEAAAAAASARGSYPFAEVEMKWQALWERDGVFVVPEEVRCKRIFRKRKDDELLFFVFLLVVNI